MDETIVEILAGFPIDEKSDGDLPVARFLAEYLAK